MSPAIPPRVPPEKSVVIQFLAPLRLRVYPIPFVAILTQRRGDEPGTTRKKNSQPALPGFIGVRVFDLFRGEKSVPPGSDHGRRGDWRI